ncbi:MAG: iron ABC transporter permease [Kiritimatiellae bacterium]|nr:iron ABC transporter permease [Kiritimatiellia bacterium]
MTFSQKKTALYLLVVMVILITPLMGVEWTNPAALWGDGGGAALERQILLQLRVPRMLTAMLAGASLAICGLIFQTLFRNPLATPYTLGVSSGAALGAVLGLALGLSRTILFLSPVIPMALGGALLTIALVYRIASSRKGFSNHTLLLAGVSVNLFCASLILLIQFLSNDQDTYRMVRWLMGSLSASDYRSTLMLALFFLPTLWFFYRRRHELDQLLTGEDLAKTRGVQVHRLRKALYFSVSVLTGILVAFCGPIGFIGIIVPHLSRRLFSFGHGDNMIPTVCCGAVLLTLCDTFARSMFSPLELPVGVVTAVLGGPFFLFILLAGSRT